MHIQIDGYVDTVLPVQDNKICILISSKCAYVSGTGVTMKLMDEVAGIVATRHCNTNIVTASVDAINFHRKIKKGENGDNMCAVLKVSCVSTFKNAVFLWLFLLAHSQTAFFNDTNR